MKKTRLAVPLTLALLLVACIAQTPQPTPVPTSRPTRAPAPSRTPEGPVQLPVVWQDMQLTGRLLLIRGTNELARLDLASGQLHPIYTADERAWLRMATLSPDGKALLLAYEPPPPEGQLLTGFSQLYVMPADASEPPRPLVETANPQEEYYSPMWSPEGDAVYYIHFLFVQVEGGARPSMTLERRPYPQGAPEVLVENPLWARLSRNGATLAYIPSQFDSAYNELYVADGDGANARAIIGSDVFEAIDAPMIAPDGQSVVVSAAEGGAAAQLSWFDRLLAVQVAAAHNVPSDWWRVAIDGSEIARLTQIGDLNLMGDFSPDGKHIAFSSLSGLWVMNADGSGLLQMMIGSVAMQTWLP